MCSLMHGSLFIFLQELLIFKELSGKDRPCRVTKFNTKIVPPPDKIKESLSDSKVSIFQVSPFKPSGLFYLNSLDHSISSLRSVWSVLIITIFY